MMFQWDAVDTNPDLEGQNVIKSFEMAIRHNRRTTRTELERVFCRRIYFHLRSKILFWPSYGGRDRSHRPHMDQSLIRSQTFSTALRKTL